MQRHPVWLERWGLVNDGNNPVARTNGALKWRLPNRFTTMHYTRPKLSTNHGGFVVAGSGEASEYNANYRAFANMLLGEIERRINAFGADWQDATGAHPYTVYDAHPFMESDIARRGAMANGLIWHFARPPVQDLDYEMDAHSVFHEMVI